MPLQPQSTWDSVNAAYIKFDTEINSATTDNQKQSLTAQKEIVRPLWEILQKADIKEGEITNLEGETNTAMDTAMEVANNDKLNKVKEELVALKNSAAREEMTGNVKGELGARRRTALTNINNFESQVRQFNALEDKAKQEAAQTKLDQVKNALTKVDNALLQIRTEENMANLEGNGIKTLKTSIAGILISVNDEINELDKELGHSAVTGIAVAESIIVGDDKGSKLINDLFKAESAEQSVNIWKRVAFSVGPNSGSSSTEESQVPATTDVSVGKRWASVHGSTSFSSSSKDVQSQISSCNVNGSFSAMVVKIKRPWLHSDLFQDFDVDVPVGTLLSPGAQKIKEWVEKGDSGTGDVTRAQFGIFPAYPTAFVVAADTALEFMSTADNSSEMMKSLATDSSIQASYGPWGLKCGASATTSSEESSQIMSVQDGSLRISFQAPQIIAWVSEILPQLPRGTDPSDMPAHPNVVIR